MRCGLSTWTFSILLLGSLGSRAEPADGQARQALVVLPTFAWMAPGDGETLPTNAVLFSVVAC